LRPLKLLGLINLQVPELSSGYSESNVYVVWVGSAGSFVHVPRPKEAVPRAEANAKGGAGFRLFDHAEFTPALCMPETWQVSEPCSATPIRPDRIAFTCDNSRLVAR
jgi:hypothetical protein